MFKEAIINKMSMRAIITMCVSVGVMCSCTNSNDNIAESLYSQASEQYQSGNYQQSVALLDSLKNNYKDDIDILKKGLYLRVLNQEGLIKDEIASNDSLISVLESENMELSGSFKYVKLKDMVEGYYIHKSIADKAGDDNRSTVEPRIDEADMFYIVSYLKGNSVSHTSVALSSAAGEVSSKSVAYDKSRNYRYNSDGIAYESIIFTNQECDTLGYFVANNNSSNVKLTFKGKKQYSVKLEPKMIKAINETYRFATNKNRGKSAIKKKMFLEQKLQLAQKQIEQTKASLQQ